MKKHLKFTYPGYDPVIELQKARIRKYEAERLSEKKHIIHQKPSGFCWLSNTEKDL